MSDVLGFEVTRVGKTHEVCAFVEFTFMWDGVGLPPPKGCVPWLSSSCGQLVISSSQHRCDFPSGELFEDKQL